MNRSGSVIDLCRTAIEAQGWQIVETRHGDDVHLVLTRDDQRKGFGLYPRLYAWTSAYESVTGQRWHDVLEQ